MSRASFRCIAILSLCLASGCAGPSERDESRPHEPRWIRYKRHELPVPSYDVDHYTIELTLRPESGSIEGRCTVRVVALEELEKLVLDLVELDVTEVIDLDRGPLEFRQRADELEIGMGRTLKPGEGFEVAVAYSGTPKTGLWFSGEDLRTGDPNQCFTQGQPEENKGWFPCFDHPSDFVTSEIIVTLPPDWIGVAAGDCIDVQEAETFRREHWRMMTPHSVYLISLVAGELERIEEDWQGVPLSYVFEAKYRDWIEASFEETGAILGFLEDYTGVPYPYSKYSQAVVANFPGGGMENVSATTLTPLTLGDELSQRDRTSLQLVAHEAAHQWFGNLVTCRDWSHLWLNEGFATYLSMLFIEETRGKEEFLCELRAKSLRYLAEDQGQAQRPAVHGAWREPKDIFDTRTYEGAALRLHLLRFFVTDKVFRQGIHDYLVNHSGGSVVTGDFQRAMEKASGRDLDRFFEEWIYGQGFPELEVEWHFDAEEELVVGKIRQTQDFVHGAARVFHVPFELEVVRGSESERHIVELTQRTSSFELPAKERPDFVVFDPDLWCPKIIRWPQREASEWLAILGRATSVDARRNAALLLGEQASRLRRDDEARESIKKALIEALDKDPNPWVRADAANGLAWVLEGEVWSALQEAAAEDAQARVRVAALRSLSFCGPHSGLARFGRTLFEEGFSWETMGAAAGLVCAADPEGAPAWLLQKLELESPHDHLAALLLAHLARFPGRTIEEELELWAQSETLAPTARAVCVRGLAHQPVNRGAVREVLFSLFDEENFRLRQAVIESVGALGGLASRRVLTDYYPRSRTAEERRAIEASVQTRF